MGLLFSSESPNTVEIKKTETAWENDWKLHPEKEYNYVEGIYHYCIRRSPIGTTWNGYVGIPQNHIDYI